MKRITVILLSSWVLAGCTVASNYKNTSRNVDNNISKVKLSDRIFTYPLDTNNRPRPAIKILAVGKFLEEDGCLMFQSQNKLITPIFPENFTNYEDGDDKVIVNDEEYKIGETLEISIRGRQNSVTTKFANRGSDHCLTDQVITLNL